ncbi:SAVED domain-containing protein [Persephonella sp.]
MSLDDLLAYYGYDFLKAKITDGKIEKENLCSYYRIFNSEYDELKFVLYKTLRKHPHLVDVSVLSRILNIPEKIIFKIFYSTYREAYFPVSTGKILRILTVPVDESVVLSSCVKEEDIQIIEQLTGRKFFAVFSDRFEGSSYMLALYSSLKYSQEILRSYSFTGVIGADGEIYEVGFLSEKEKASKTAGLKLISPLHVSDVKELNYWLGGESIDIPFLYLRNKKDPEKILESFEKTIRKNKKNFSLKGLEKIFDIKREDLYINLQEDLPPVKDSETSQLWKNEIKKFEKKITGIYTKIKDKKRVLHLASSIASLSLGLGVKLGARKPVVLYHYQSDEYIPVIDLSDSRKIRKIKYVRKHIDTDLRYITVSYPASIEKSEDVAVGIWLASHNPFDSIERYIKANGTTDCLVEIESKDFQGDIPLPSDFEDITQDYWRDIVSEIYSVLNVLKYRYRIRRFHLFLSVPVPIATALGMALGHFIDIIVYNYNTLPEVSDKELYFPVFNLKDELLKSKF